jgi:hypothetical protein
MRSAWLLVALVATVASSGCGPANWGTATGTVTVDDQPLKSGVVTFQPVAGGAAAYGQVTDGKFTLYTGQDAGLKAGQYQVTVAAQSVPEPGSKDRAKLLTPEKYASPATSGLKEEVRAGSNNFELRLKSE